MDADGQYFYLPVYPRYAERVVADSAYYARDVRAVASDVAYAAHLLRRAGVDVGNLFVVACIVEAVLPERL